MKKEKIRQENKSYMIMYNKKSKINIKGNIDLD